MAELGKAHRLGRWDYRFDSCLSDLFPYSANIIVYSCEFQRAISIARYRWIHNENVYFLYKCIICNDYKVFLVYLNLVYKINIIAVNRCKKEAIYMIK